MKIDKYIKCFKNRKPVFSDEAMEEYGRLSQSERQKLGAFWTPPEIITQMMAMTATKSWKDPSKTFLDPTCGAGNILVCVLLNKIYHGSTPSQAVKTIYGIEMCKSTVKICRDRICRIVGERYRPIVEKNIVCSDFFNWNLEEWRPYTAKELKSLKRR